MAGQSFAEKHERARASIVGKLSTAIEELVTSDITPQEMLTIFAKVGLTINPEFIQRCMHRRYAPKASNAAS